MEEIVFLATAWGRTSGGVNSFNKDLVGALAKILSPESYRITLITPNPSLEDRAELEQHNVRLLGISEGKYDNQWTETQAYEIIGVLKESASKVSWWVGHDVITGMAALKACEYTNTGKVAIFHHTNYMAFKAYQQADGEDIIRKDGEQRELLRAADVVLGIGPKLAKHALSVCGTDGPRKVFEIIPGLPEINPHSGSENFKAIIFGRMNPKEDAVKQGRLAIAGISRAIGRNPDGFGPDATILLFGVDANLQTQVQADLQRHAEFHAGRSVNLIVAPFTDTRERLFDHLADSSVCLMLSRHEGFGLTAWEAIGAGTPLITTKNSGVYTLINERLGGKGNGCLRSIALGGAGSPETLSEHDIQLVSEAVESIWKDRENRENTRRDALELKSLLTHYTWEEAAATMARACDLKSIYLVGDEPGAFVRDMLFENEPFDEIVKERQRHYQQIWDGLAPDGKIKKHLILFGGISTKLSDADASLKYAIWLLSRPQGEVYICYESGPASERRATSLDPASLFEANDTPLPWEPIERMEMKEQQVRKIRDYLQERLSDKWLERLHLIPLSLPLTNYIMLADDDMYIAPVLHQRSSRTMSMRLPRVHTPYRDQFLGYMLYHLRDMSEVPGVAPLAELLSRARYSPFGD